MVGNSPDRESVWTEWGGVGGVDGDKEKWSEQSGDQVIVMTLHVFLRRACASWDFPQQSRPTAAELKTSLL